MANELFCKLSHVLGYSVFAVKSIYSSSWRIIYIHTVSSESHIKIECRRSLLQKESPILSIINHLFSRNDILRCERTQYSNQSIQVDLSHWVVCWRIIPINWRQYNSIWSKHLCGQSFNPFFQSMSDKNLRNVFRMFPTNPFPIFGCWCVLKWLTGDSRSSTPRNWYPECKSCCCDNFIHKSLNPKKIY